MAGLNETRIVLLGKTGVGKSSLGNTILGKSLLKAKMSSKSVTEECQAESKVINGVCTTVIDTPGFFDTKKDEKRLITEIIKSVKQWLPGPHAFLIVLKVERFSEQERDVINKILKYFSAEALKHAVVVFTYGDELDEGCTIKDFVGKDETLSELVEKCGGRCHVVDNRHWNKPGDYRNNQFHVAQLLNTVETMKKTQGFYRNEFLKKVEEDKSGNFLKFFAGATVGVLLGAVFGFTLGPGLVVFGGAAVGGVIGGAIGSFSETPQEAVVETAKTVQNLGMAAAEIRKMTNFK